MDLIVGCYILLTHESLRAKLVVKKSVTSKPKKLNNEENFKNIKDAEQPNKKNKKN
jgi:hypothetical protein